MTSSDWNSGNVYLKCTNLRVYIFSRISRILVDFTKLNTRKIFFQTAFVEIDTRQVCKKFKFPENKYKKKYMHKKCWLIQLFLESINNNSFSIVACLYFRWSWQKN